MTAGKPPWPHPAGRKSTTTSRTRSAGALDRGALGLEDAIRSATGLPAQILGLTDRGALPGRMIPNRSRVRGVTDGA